MFVSNIVSDKLLKTYPWLKGHLYVSSDSIIFSIKSEYPTDCEFNLLEVDFSDYTSIHLSGVILDKDIGFPSILWFKTRQKTFKRNLEDNPASCYKVINKYIPKIKEAIDWYDSVHCDQAEMTLKELGFKEFATRWYLRVNNITVKVILPSARYPCFVANVLDDKGLFIAGSFYCTTFDELLRKLIDEKEK